MKSNLEDIVVLISNLKNSPVIASLTIFCEKYGGFKIANFANLGWLTRDILHFSNTRKREISAFNTEASYLVEY